MTVSRTLLQLLLACFNFTLDPEDLVRTKEFFSMSYDSNTSSWKRPRWVRLDLMFTLKDIHINSNLDPSNRRSTKFKGIFPKVSLKWSQKPSQPAEEYENPCVIFIIWKIWWKNQPVLKIPTNFLVLICFV